MSEQSTKRYMELQMEELKEALTSENEENKPSKNSTFDEKNAKLAELYEDAAEYEAELELLEKELALIEQNELHKLPKLLGQDGELKAIIEATWPHEEDRVAIQEQTFAQFIENFKEHEDEIKELLTKRWELLIEIKKEHIKEEHAEIKTAGLKPHFVKRIYKQVHNIK